MPKASYTLDYRFVQKDSGIANYRRREKRLGYFLLTPCILFLAIFAVYPLFHTIKMSFTHFEMFGMAGGFTFNNFMDTFRDKYFWDSLGVTLFFVVTSVVFQTLFGFVLAFLANKSFKGQGLARVALLLPWAMPPVVAAMAWRWMANDSFGLFNDILTRVGLSDGHTVWLGIPKLAMFCLVTLAVWKVSSFMGLLILAGLQAISEELYEAADLDGAGKVKRFFHITLPLLKPTLAVAVLLRTLQAVQVFDLPYTLTGGGPGNATETLGIFIYRSSFSKMDWGGASAQSVILLAISIVITIIYFKLTRQETY